ncbi:hypothetical protein [Clostridium argentinense]|uniref:hypothetical protein n=1 Tax=Clostridium argentinense TaxID=29341 RepID=UPI000AC58D96|nr:hypothetical protein [Clostridium argentinense]
MRYINWIWGIGAATYAGGLTLTMRHIKISKEYTYRILKEFCINYVVYKEWKIMIDIYNPKSFTLTMRYIKVKCVKSTSSNTKALH